MNVNLSQYIIQICDWLVIDGQRPSKVLVEPYVLKTFGIELSPQKMRNEITGWYSHLGERLNRSKEGCALPEYILKLMDAMYQHALLSTTRAFEQTYQLEPGKLRSEKIHQGSSWNENDLLGRHQAQRPRYTDTFFAAFEICEELINEGTKPGSGHVYKRLKRGSMTVIQQAVDTWWSELPQRLFRVRLNPHFPDEMYLEAEKLYKTMLEDITDKYPDKLNVMPLQEKNINLQFQSLLNHVKLLEQQLKEFQSDTRAIIN